MADLAQSLLLLIILSLLMMIIAGDASEMGGSTNHSYFEDCPVTSCEKHGQQIRFPFRNKDHQLPKCGYPGFDVSCKGKQMVLQLPLSGEFFVQDIDYGRQIVRLADPNGCTPRRLLNLNLSSSPFQIFYFYGHYNGSDIYSNNVTCVKCSTNISSTDIYDSDFHSIPCLSGWGRYFYATFSSDSGERLPSTCDVVNSNMPYFFYYNRDYYQDISFFLMKWESPDCNNCEERGQRCRLDTTTNGTTACFPFHPHRKGNEHVIIGTSLGILVVVIAVVVTVLIYFSRNPNRKKEKEDLLKVERFIKDYKDITPARYSYADIKRITSGFKNKLGQGAYGSVFKGLLSNETQVAVKILERSKGDGEEFINEVATIGRVHHVNVVRLLGFCAEGFKRALIYEFMPNKSLEKFILSRETENPCLSWKKLYEIAVGIARGIQYLHGGCDKRILHFDIKPHNILLDHNFHPKITDFGLAKLCSKEESIVSMITARGTMGYIAPEMFSRNFGEVSLKSDVYSFGMLLIEMVGGRDNIDTTTENPNHRNFIESIYTSLHQGRGLELRVESEVEEEIVKKLTIVALWCIQWNPADRPSMKRVVHMLEGDLSCLELPPEPFVPSNKPAKQEVSPSPNPSMA